MSIYYLAGAIIELLMISENLKIGFFVDDALPESSKNIARLVDGDISSSDNAEKVPLKSVTEVGVKAVDVLIIHEEMAKAVLEAIANNNLVAMHLLIITESTPENLVMQSDEDRLELNGQHRTITHFEYVNQPILDTIKHFFLEREAA
jgi:hypothetical protein